MRKFGLSTFTQNDTWKGKEVDKEPKRVGGHEAAGLKNNYQKPKSRVLNSIQYNNSVSKGGGRFKV